MYIHLQESSNKEEYYGIAFDTRLKIYVPFRPKLWKREKQHSN